MTEKRRSKRQERIRANGEENRKGKEPTIQAKRENKRTYREIQKRGQAGGWTETEGEMKGEGGQATAGRWRAKRGPP